MSTSFYNVDRIVKRLDQEQSRRQRVDVVFKGPPYSDIGKAVEDIVAEKLRVVGVAGVPGAGKTTFYAYLLSNLLGDSLCRGAAENLYIYIAPTNELLVDFLEKFAAFMSARGGCRSSDFAKAVRIYGSKISASEFTQLLKRADERVGLIISTDWQRVYARMYPPRPAYLLIDEASRMTLARFLVPIADGLAKGKPDDLIRGFAVIGDPNQAIGISEDEREWLLLEKAVQLREQGSDYVEIKRLDVSMRLPPETETPIKEGYYAGDLRAMGKPYLLGLTSDEVKEVMKRVAGDCERYGGAVEEALTKLSNTPLLYIETEVFEKGDQYDIERAKLTSCLAKAIRAAVELKKDEKRIAVVAPYGKMAFAARILAGDADIRFSTVASFLGREDDIIIAPAAKEYTDIAFWTYYFSDPYIFNVQLSRQRGTLVVIGHMTSLKEETETLFKRSERGLKRLKKTQVEGLRKLMKTAEMFENLEETKKVVAR
ncbi:AAA domain-containing protein [Pyrobaculum neutrophilum]|uniref:Uncharacterized protein n=1 Tax=Pyrobaculum neutrophilum (strain DSM 2338 / JCM 9278 / NBRC 100436 / V24Sta) TaxID=444157 RepID=B1YE31_PYRNV|nr:AAA domain-containing protein [Pyrobaculum neutrophilum]ACB40044.1 hypothetical protein Tneu_1113 [Pyrobaculum neutrophilum V24Sta]